MRWFQKLIKRGGSDDSDPHKLYLKMDKAFLGEIFSKNGFMKWSILLQQCNAYLIFINEKKCLLYVFNVLFYLLCNVFTN